MLMLISSRSGRAGFARLCNGVQALLIAVLLAPIPAGAAPLRETSGAELRALAVHHASLPPAVPIADKALLQRSSRTEVRLAPDGSAIAYLDLEGNSGTLQLYDLASRNTRVLLKNMPRAALSWSRDSRVLFLISPGAITSLDVHAGRATRLGSYDPPLEQQVIALDPALPQHILVDEYDRNTSRSHLWRIAADGAREQLYEGKRLSGIAIDAQGRLAFIKTLDERYNQIVARRDGAGWREIARCRPARTCSLQASSADGSKLFLLGVYNEDRRALLEIDAASGKQRVLHSDPEGVSDLRNVVLAADSRLPLIASYDMPRRRNYGLTPAAQRAVADVGRRFGESNVLITPAAPGKPWLLTESGSQLQYERYWLYDPLKRSFESILPDAASAPRLPPKHAVRFRASDGMLIHGYLTLPSGIAPARLPIVTLLHGGPWARVDNEFQVLPQWLANKGYAVFQPNFRASTGYGDKYMLAAGMDFANGRVLKDMTDGVQWLLANGLGDRRRLAVAGESFGGYAALLALTHAPDMFQFGLAAVPPPDFARTIRLAATQNLAGTDDVPSSVRFGEMGITLADTASIATLSAGSPAANVKKLYKPLVMLAGARDDKVEIAAVSDYAARLQAAGKPVSLLIDPAAGHNPDKPVLREAYMHLLARLLHDYLGGPPPAAPGAELQTYLQRTVKMDKAFP